jgi:hypothetical protein
VKKLSQNARKLMRKVYLTICAGAVSIIFVACYGMPPDWDWDHYTDCTEIVIEEENGE